jgi:hypothetical protein
MAMNKYGRATKMTTYPPDKVVKNKDGTTTTTSGKTSVTMSDWIQPEKTPTPKGYISQDDYNAYEAKRREVMGINAAKYKPYNDAMSAYQQEQGDYKASMDKYKRELDFYNKGPEPQTTPGVPIATLKGGKNRQGANVTFSSAPRYSAAQANADLKRAMKENKNIVDINDPSISPSSRNIWMTQVGSDLKGHGNDLYGRPSANMYVDRDAINKIKSNRDIWGEDFDKTEWAKASKGKDFDKYLAQKGYKDRTFVPNSSVGAYQGYFEPQSPKAPTSKMPVKPVIQEDPLPPKPKERVFLGKMPTRKALGITSEPSKMKYAEEIKGIKEGTWEEPTGGKFKRKGEIVKSREGGQDQKPSIFSKRIKTESSKGGYGIRRSPDNSVSKGLRAREEKMAKAFYSPESEWGRGGYYALEGTEEKNWNKAIRSDVKDIRAEKREWKKETSSKGSDRRPALQGFREDIKTGRLAARYAKRGDLDMLGGEDWEEGSKSRLKIYTPDKTNKGKAGAMAGYVKSAEQNIEAARLYKQNETSFNQNAFAAENINKQPRKIKGFAKTATDNATNRNTVKAKMENYKGWNRFVQ